MSSLYYHVTTTKSLPSIMLTGLSPKIGIRSRLLGEPVPAIYFFKDRQSTEDAIVNWLGDCFGESEILCILECDLTDIPLSTGMDQFEAICYAPVPSSRLTVVYSEEPAMCRLY